MWERFNPHPREGGDAIPVQAVNASNCFNPHPREGGDDGPNIRDRALTVSIRTPVKGVMQVDALFTHEISFNPHPREGGDSMTPHVASLVVLFQSAPP